VPAAVVNLGLILSTERMLHKDCESKYSIEKMMVVSFKGLVAKMN
jgi:hypothetical protein